MEKTIQSLWIKPLTFPFYPGGMAVFFLEGRGESRYEIIALPVQKGMVLYFN